MTVHVSLAETVALGEAEALGVRLGDRVELGDCVTEVVSDCDAEAERLDD